MPLRLEIKKKLSSRSERVKSVDFHPTEPWVLSALYSGHLIIYNWEEQLSVKSFEVCSGTAVRCAKFIPQKEWVICGSDDMAIRVFNYHTTEKIKQFDAHADFIRYIAVHPSLPLVLSVSDDMTARLWDWAADWARVATFEGHTHYVMVCEWNPKDPHIFATASLDRSIKIWGTQSTLGSATSSGAKPPPGGLVLQPHFNLLGHESGVNCLQYALSGEKPYIVSGGDDHTVRVWDYQAKQCVTVLSGHSKPVLSVTFHPYLPIIISGGEDGLANLWHATTYRLESSLNYGMGRLWGITPDKQSNAVALALDEGTVVIKLGSEKPVASMQGGKIIMAKSSDIQAVNVRLADESLFSDGERLPLSVKDMGACEVFPQAISHHPNGRLIAVCGDGEYVVYTAQALRNKAYGKAVDFVWSSEGHYAVRSDTGMISVFHQFKEHKSIKLPYHVEELFGGRLIGVRGSDFICFYDWTHFRLIRRIDVQPHGVFWKDSGTSVILACQDSSFVLEYNQEDVSQYLSTPTESGDEEGSELAFQLEHEISERLESGVWVGDCFVFTTPRLRLQTLISGLVDTAAFLDRPCWLLGYVLETNRLYLIDRQLSVISYKLDVTFIQYQSAITRRDFDTAATLFDQIPASLHNKVAKFLEAQGHHQKALEVTKDLDHKFELARSLGHLELCARVIREAQQAAASRFGETTLERPFVAGSPQRTAEATTVYRNQWKQLGDLALERGSIPLALACFQEAQDVNGLLLIYASTGDAKGLRATARLAARIGKPNVAVVGYLLLKDVDSCIKTLVAANRVPEAALFARTYAPSRLQAVVDIWKLKLKEAKHESIANALAEPEKHPDFFPEFDEVLKAEEVFRRSVVEAHKKPMLATTHKLNGISNTFSAASCNDGLELCTASGEGPGQNTTPHPSRNGSRGLRSEAENISNVYTSSLSSSVDSSTPDFNASETSKSLDIGALGAVATPDDKFVTPAVQIEKTVVSDMSQPDIFELDDSSCPAFEETQPDVTVAQQPSSSMETLSVNMAFLKKNAS